MLLVITPMNTPGPSRYAGKVALVTGAGTGIGAAVAERLAAEGARVVLTGRRPEPLHEVAERIGPAALAVPADSSEPDQIGAVVGQAVDRFEGLDVLVAAAGGHHAASAGEISDRQWADDLRTNLDTALCTVRASLEQLQRAHGNVVLVGSIAGLFAGPEVVGYVTAKHALVGLMRSVARDYGPAGVRANVVAPGWVRTAMADQQMDELAEARGVSRDAAYELVTRDVPLRRPATPEEIAAVIAFVGSGEAAIISGAVLVADGGAGCVDLPTVEFAR